MGLFFQPAKGTAGDFIPFYQEGIFHLFHTLHNSEEPGGPKPASWHHVVTQDFLEFEDWGEALPAGQPADPDLCVYNGCVFERKDQFHIFYTGRNVRNEKSGKPLETILHATSRNLRTWIKDPTFSFSSLNSKGYSPNDWRDPFVFLNPETREYWMLIAAKRTAFPERHDGCIALAASHDLKEWTLRKPLWTTGSYGMCESPDLFRMGAWWYLLYSTFTDQRATHYRMARSLAGPWRAPNDDLLDGPYWYAGKTAGDGRRRFVFGWLGERQDNRDDHPFDWGGPLVVHQLEQRRDGTLALRAPESILKAFPLEVASTPEPVLGAWIDAEREAICNSPDRWSGTRWSDLPDTALVELEMKIERSSREAGLLLRMDRALERYYQIRFDPARQRITMDRWPRAPGDPAFMAERAFAFSPGRTIILRLLIDGPCAVLYANDQTAFSARMCKGAAGGGFGFYVAEGSARFRHIYVRRQKTLWE